MSRITIILASFLLAINAYGQRVFYTSRDVSQPDTDTGQTIRNVRPNWAFSPRITVVYKDGHREKIARKAIWGYEDRRNRVYRYYEKSFYRFVGTNDVVRYHRLINLGRAARYVSYFSKALDSPIRRTKRKVRKDLSAAF